MKMYTVAKNECRKIMVESLSTGHSTPEPPSLAFSESLFRSWPS